MIAFKSPAQESLFNAVTSHLEGIGYLGDLLSRNYPFTDWFELEDVDRVAPVVTFGRVPTTYETTCHVVALSNGRSGPALAAEFRALGAARLFEVHEDRVSVWRIGQSVTPSDEQLVIPAGQLTQRFQENAEAWRPESVLRAKEIGVGTGEKQLDFFDTGLLVALEGHIRVKLGDLLREALAKASQAYHRSLAGLDPTETQQLFRLVFRFLAAKVLHDRGVGEFASLSASDDAGDILDKASQYYGRSDAVLADQAVRDAIKSTIWGRLNLQNLSVEVLAYIYEFTLVSHSLRKRLGIHGTPPSIARYIVRNLPIDRIPRDERLTVEPCSGHAVFLVAAIQRLRELLPPDMAAAERHKYFVRMLRGFEIDAFALEVSLLCLMLADFPNPNGWEMVNADVFDSPAFDAALKEARIVLCNPPYEDIPIEKRADYGNLRSVHKPDEIIHRVLDNLHPNGMLGFVLPRRVLDDRGSRAIRRKLAEQFDEIEIVELPESRVFYVSEHPSVLVLAKRRSRGGGLVHLQTTVFEKADAGRFLNQFRVVRKETYTITVDEAAECLVVPALQDVWDALDRHEKLVRIADIHVGLEWRATGENDRHYSDAPEPGFERGYARVDTERMLQFTPPSTSYVHVEEKNQRRNAYKKYDWKTSKVFVNANRITRKGHWRHAAFIDYEGLISTENFLAAWPKAQTVAVEVIAAVLNNPVAAAYVRAHEGGRRNSIDVLRSIPTPTLTAEELSKIAELVRSYLDKVSGGGAGSSQHQAALDLLLQIDGILLKGYNLPPHLEKKLLDYFQGSTRPVPFPFTGYDLEAFLPVRILADADDPRAEWSRINERRVELIDKEEGGELTQDEQEELERIQKETGRFSNIIAPLPFELLERFEERARQLGLQFEQEEA